MARCLSLEGVLRLCLVLLPFAAGCDETSSDSSAVAAVRVDACQPAVVVLDADATESQQDGARAAIDLWNRRASTRLTVSQAPPESVDGAASPTPGPPALPLHFRQAASLSHGFFDPASGQILINLDLADHELAVTIAHEVGHAFGLVHVTGRPSVMTSGNLVVEPNEGDVAALSKLWGACAPAAPPTP